MLQESPPTCRVIGFPVTALPVDAQTTLMFDWAKQRLSKLVCFANVHMLVEGYRSSSFANILRTADLVAPDGVPLVWMLRLLGVTHQERVAGMDLLPALCKLAPAHDVSIFFLGSDQKTLDLMRARLDQDCPDLKIAGMEPLPFRPLTPAEDEALIQKLNQSGAGIVMVSLGCPKQEIWIAQHKGRVHAVMLGLGAAFPVYARTRTMAPQLIR